MRRAKRRPRMPRARGKEAMERVAVAIKEGEEVVEGEEGTASKKEIFR